MGSAEREGEAGSRRPAMDATGDTGSVMGVHGDGNWGLEITTLIWGFENG